LAAERESALYIGLGFGTSGFGIALGFGCGMIVGFGLYGTTVGFGLGAGFGGGMVGLDRAIVVILSALRGSAWAC